MNRHLTSVTTTLCAALVAAFGTVPLRADETPQERLQAATAVFSEIMSTPDKGIPQDLLAKSHCIVIVPGLKKGAFIVGGKFGRGFLSCRASSGHGWSAPGAVRVEGGSVGLQIGASETDVILLVMNARGAEKLLSSQFTLGGEGEPRAQAVVPEPRPEVHGIAQDASGSLWFATSGGVCRYNGLYWDRLGWPDGLSQAGRSSALLDAAGNPVGTEAVGVVTLTSGSFTVPVTATPAASIAGVSLVIHG